MRGPAEQFLTWRAFGAPPIVIALAAQGTFRGFKDTKTPLYAIGKYCGLPSILIFLYRVICYLFSVSYTEIQPMQWNLKPIQIHFLLSTKGNDLFSI